MSELLFREDPYLPACEARVVAVREGAVELERTVFYPAGGGQPGDSGRIGAWRVVDTRKGETPDSVLHILEPGFELRPGDTVRAEIDWERRHRHMRFHTALHLLCAAVRAPVTGGRIAADKAHLDFDIEMEKLVKEEIEERVNALAAGAHAGVDLQACGGTHVRNTAEIGPLAVARIRSEGRRNKRVTLVLT